MRRTWRTRGRPALHRPKVDYGTQELQRKREHFHAIVRSSSPDMNDNTVASVNGSGEQKKEEIKIVTLFDYLKKRQILEDWEQDFLKQYHRLRCRALIQQKRLPSHIAAIYKNTGSRSTMQREMLEGSEAQWVLLAERLPVEVVGCFDAAVFNPLDYDISVCKLNTATMRLTQCLAHYSDVIQEFLKCGKKRR